ncbi:MAG: hypothetical protein RMX65_008865 [Nostoc sp. DedQUE01]|nr:hypothetical protein [Nostoc sp. DedQUE11]MDZ8076058.1 hypothetical protein [Nostoc sp. DedQUE01]MDZ8079132.1 hypothetical protein [Nostoc sp. DcaGUA01]
MSSLTEGLNRIFVWLDEHYPDIASSLSPGLSYGEITKKIGDLPFKVSDEVYEIFQWRNGSQNNSIFGGASLFSLNGALTLYQNFEDYFLDSDIKTFPIFTNDNSAEYYFAICETLEELPIITIGFDEPEIIVKYTSLTNMILSIAEAYESKVFIRDERYGYIKIINPDLFQSIRYKYNHKNKVDLLYEKQLIIR